jgi:Fungal Zn(2)-Cys(6) binuclear cluster domain
MFSCHLCGRAYATQNSLTRHSHNHGKDKSHVCTECHVVFSRRDLLVRHSKIHAILNVDQRPGGRRLRCHTACVNCRRSRTKCDGDGTKPCTSCSNNNKECTFSATSNRVSEDIRIKDHEISRYSSNSLENEADRQSPLDDSFDFSAVLQASDMAQPLRSIVEGDFHTVMDPTSFSPMQMTAWPWLHEDMFFQNGTPSDWHQLVLDHAENGDNAAHPILLNGISGSDVNMSSPSAAGDYSRELLEHEVSGHIPRQLPENERTRAMAHANPTLLTQKTQNVSHSKLSNDWPLLVGAS